MNAFVERGLIAQRPGISRRFLLDDGADNLRPQRTRFGSAAREGDEFAGGESGFTNVADIQGWRGLNLSRLFRSRK